MYSFIVLGIIPGTNIQITFTTWLNAMLVAISAVLLVRLYRLVVMQNFAPAVNRQPLFAQQLHSRSI